MDLTGEYTIPASREQVWRALNDPEVLKRCIPGCEELNQTSPTELNAKVTTKIGPVKAKFAGTVTLSDLDPPRSYRITGEGKGGTAGFAKGSAVVELDDADGGGTRLAYKAEALVGGKLAQIGQRLIGGTAQKLADEFFGNLVQQIGEPGATEPAATQPSTPAPSRPAAPASPPPATPPSAHKPAEAARSSEPTSPPRAPAPGPTGPSPGVSERAPTQATSADEKDSPREPSQDEQAEMYEAAVRAAAVGHTRPQAPRRHDSSAGDEAPKHRGLSALSKISLLVLAVLLIYAIYLVTQ